ncbi:MAG: energy-coupling factor ABC transporter ATP-binding protein [Gemmataceae bacterium]
MIAVESLNYAYPDGATALDGVSFHVGPGERVGLVGPNGAGKTTLFLCLAGALRTAAGMVRVAGLDPAKVAERPHVHAKVGIVFQNSDDQLFHATVFDDVAFGPLNLGLPPDEVRARVVDALAQVGLTGCEQRTPMQLSGGQKRRAALAGIMAMRPAVLLLDEPTSALDPRGRREFLALLKSLPGTHIVASHDLDFVRAVCSRVLVLDGGRIAADGPCAEVFANRELMESHGLI